MKPTKSQIKEEARRNKLRETVYGVTFKGSKCILQHFFYGYLVFQTKREAEIYIKTEMKGKYRANAKIVKMKLTKVGSLSDNK